MGNHYINCTKAHNGIKEATAAGVMQCYQYQIVNQFGTYSNKCNRAN